MLSRSKRMKNKYFQEKLRKRIEFHLLKSKVNTNQIQVTGLLYLQIYDSLIFLVSLSLKIFPFIYFSIVVDLNWELKELRPVVRG